MGRNAFFIRLYGCPIHCPWCDSAGTWHKEFLPRDIERMTAAQLTSRALESGAETIVITGGEPTIFDLSPLTNTLHSQGFAVHLETSGAFEIKGFFDWITLSPKKWKTPLLESVKEADEFKIIVESAEDIVYYSNLLHSLDYLQESPTAERRPIWLHPEWGLREDPEVIRAICDAVKETKARNRQCFRAGWQLHKLYRIDTFDVRSRPPVPLGGDPTRGF